MFASSSGKFDIVKLLHEKNIDLNAQDNNGENSIHYCCRCANVDAAKQIIEFLATHGVPLDIQNKVTHTLHVICHQSRIPLLSLWLFKNGETALHIAARYGCTDIIRYLCENSANLDLQDDVTLVDNCPTGSDSF
jgi:ankyrin repeat protein